MSPPISEVWSYFQKRDNKTANCKKCFKLVKYCGNTSNLHKHIKNHAIILSKKRTTVLSPYVLTGRDRRVTRIVNSDPNSECSFLASFWPKGGARWNALRAPE